MQYAATEGNRLELIRRRGDFLWPIDRETAPVRDRGELPAASRKLELISPEEVQKAIVETVTSSMGIERTDIPTEACRKFGFLRVTETMKGAVLSQVQEMIEDGRLLERDGHVEVAE